MAELTAFNYVVGHSWLHRLDIRIKLIIVFYFNIISIRAETPALIYLSVPLLFIIAQVKLPVRKSLIETRYFLYFLVFIFLSRTLRIDINSPVFFNYSSPDMIESLIICWRLFLILLVGLVFMFSSKVTEIKSAVQWYLSFIPIIPGKKIALMIGLMIRFVPDVLQHAADISEAQKARCINNRKNPFHRVISFTTPLFLRVFEQVDTIVNAMLSRCYNEDRNDLELKSSASDWYRLCLISGYFALFHILKL